MAKEMNQTIFHTRGEDFQLSISSVIIHPLVWKLDLMGLIGIAYEVETDSDFLIEQNRFLEQCSSLICRGLSNLQIQLEGEKAAINRAFQAEIAEKIIELIPDQKAI